MPQPNGGAVYYAAGVRYAWQFVPAVACLNFDSLDLEIVMTNGWSSGGAWTLVVVLDGRIAKSVCRRRRARRKRE